MQNPTHIELTVIEANDLPIRGKYSTNDAYIVVTLGRDKFQTSIIERGFNPFVWKDETFLLEIPRQGNTAVIQLSVFHKRILGDECLGVASIFLKDFQPTVNPKLMTYSLEGKSEKYPSQGQITVELVFREIYFQDGTQYGSKKRMKVVAEEIIKSLNLRKSNRTMSLRNIVQALVSEKRSQCKVVENPKLDSNDNEVTPIPTIRHHSAPKLIRIKSARGKINASRDLQFIDTAYIREKVVPSPKNYSSTESELEKEEDLESVSPDIPEFVPKRPARANTIEKVDNEVTATEFRGEAKQTLVDMILQLRKIVSLQQQKITDLENYIDGRLARVMSRNPGSLEIDD